MTKVQQALESAPWRYAKTMPWVPHFYVLEKEWNHPIPFRRMCELIVSDGVAMVWGKMKPKPYLDVGQWRYWIMSPDPKDAILINREKIEGSTAVLP